jgi:hypothetical protein
MVTDVSNLPIQFDRDHGATLRVDRRDAPRLSPRSSGTVP